MRPRGSVAAKMLRTAASLSGPGAIRPMRAACRTALAAAALLAAGCMSPHGAIATDVNSASWSDPAPLTLANADTTTLRDVNLFLRCNDRFAEDSLTVHIRVRTPDSLQHEEPFVMVIPPAHTPAAISREADIPYRRRVLFDRTGDYHLTITPCRPVEGIDLGYLVQRTNGFTGADLAHLVDSAVEYAMMDSVRTGNVRMVTMQDFLRALEQIRPSAGPWFVTARNIVEYGNREGEYDDLAEYMKANNLM